MHLFIIDLFISLDTVAPLIDGLNRNKQKTKICFTNPLQDFSNHKLVQYLMDQDKMRKQDQLIGQESEALLQAEETEPLDPQENI